MDEDLKITQAERLTIENEFWRKTQIKMFSVLVAVVAIIACACLLNAKSLNQRDIRVEELKLEQIKAEHCAPK